MFLLPPLVSMVMFLVLWAAGLLSRPGRLGIFCATGIAVQIGSPTYSVLWVLALAVNAALAIYFLLLFKLKW